MQSLCRKNINAYKFAITTPAPNSAAAPNAPVRTGPAAPAVLELVLTVDEVVLVADATTALMWLDALAKSLLTAAERLASIVERRLLKEARSEEIPTEASDESSEDREARLELAAPESEKARELASDVIEATIELSGSRVLVVDEVVLVMEATSEEI